MTRTPDFNKWPLEGKATSCWQPQPQRILPTEYSFECCHQGQDWGEKRGCLWHNISVDSWNILSVDASLNHMSQELPLPLLSSACVGSACTSTRINPILLVIGSCSRMLMRILLFMQHRVVSSWETPGEFLPVVQRHIFPKPLVYFYLMSIMNCPIFCFPLHWLLLNCFPILYWLLSNLETKPVASTARMYDISSIIPDFILNFCPCFSFLLCPSFWYWVLLG